MAKKRTADQVRHHKSPKWSGGLLSIVFAWPFVYLFRYFIPINGEIVPIGNDFYGLYYRYKLYLLAHLDHGAIPLWSPSEAAGYPFFSNPFAQVYYPLNFLLIVWYKLVGGYNSIDYQVYAILGISIFALGLYFWLRLICSNIRSVLFSVLVLAVSFKITELLRFPNAIHSAAWHPWILYSITRILSGQSNKSAWLSGGLLLFSIYCLATAGYPYYLYYLLFLAVPYTALFFIKKLRTCMFSLETISWKRSLTVLLISGCASIAVTAPYLLAIKRMLADTVDRGGKDFAYSTKYVFNLQDTIGSLIYPPLASWEGVYFFSLTALLLMMLFVVHSFLPTKLVHVNTPTESAGFWSAKRSACLVLLVWIAVITCISWGKDSCLFKFLWDYMPGFSSLRAWGRLSVILVPLWAWFLVLAYSDFESLIVAQKESITAAVSGVKKVIGPLIVGVIYMVILFSQLYYYRNDMADTYWQRYGEHCHRYTAYFIIAGGAAFIGIQLFMLFGLKLSKRIRYTPAIIFLVLFGIAVAEMWPVGSNLWVRPKRQPEKRINPDYQLIEEGSFQKKRIYKEMTISLDSTYSTGVVRNWYFESYVRFFNNHKIEANSIGYLLGLSDGRKVFFSEKIGYEKIEPFLRDSLRFKNSGRLISYDGDVLVWEIDAQVAGYLSFIDNWDPYWKVYVDGKEETLERLFGTFKSVHLSSGKHRVEFRYEPTLRAILAGSKK